MTEEGIKNKKERQTKTKKQENPRWTLIILCCLQKLLPSACPVQGKMQDSNVWRERKGRTKDLKTNPPIF